MADQPLRPADDVRPTSGDVWCAACGPLSFDQATVDALSQGRCTILNDRGGVVVLDSSGDVLHDCRQQHNDGPVPGHGDSSRERTDGD